MAAPSDEREATFTPVLASLAGITAITAGAIYTYGALTKMTVLWGADQKVADTLPLFSLEQLLVAGIAELLQLLIWLGVLATIGVFAGSISEYRASGRKEQKSEDPAQPREEKSRVGRLTNSRYVLYGTLSLLLLVEVLISDPASLIALVLGGVAFFYALLLRRSTGLAVLGLSLTFATVVFFSNYLDPEPLPEVELAVQNSPAPVRGSLITRTNDSWYVAVEEDRFDVIPADKVMRARVRSRQQSPDTMVIERIAGD